MDDDTPQDRATEACLHEDEAATREPDGGAFVDRSDINPRRRIVRARRPQPPAASSAAGDNNANGVNNATTDGTSAVAGGRGRLNISDGPTGIRPNNSRNAGDGTDLAGAIGLLRQLDRGPAGTSDGGANDVETQPQRAPTYDDHSDDYAEQESNFQCESNEFPGAFLMQDAY